MALNEKASLVAGLGRDYVQAMPEIDLGPNSYRKRDSRSGRWLMPDDRIGSRNYFFVLLVVLGFIFWNRDSFGSDVLFGISVMFAFCAGIMLAIWLKDRY